MTVLPYKALFQMALRAYGSRLASADFLRHTPLEAITFGVLSAFYRRGQSGAR